MDDRSPFEAPECAAAHLSYFVSLPLHYRHRNELTRIFTSSYQPATLHLSACLHPDRLAALRRKPVYYGALLEDVEAAFKICEVRSVEVFWHEQDTARFFAVSPSLWRWAKERKGKLVLGNRGGDEASTSG
ncbi:hypothetical protein JCM10207_006339 [Rhodosporidiobolus poonsookiae]